MKKISIVLSLALFLSSIYISAYSNKSNNLPIISHVVSPKNIAFYFKNNDNKPFHNFKNLKHHLSTQYKELLFAMNGGMYLKDSSPQGLYIEKGKLLKKVDRTEEAYGNFYMQPNGIFYITKDAQAFVKTTKQFRYNKNIAFATQSGPMLLIDGKRHHRFMPLSKNVHIRNGVGVLPNGDLLFAISKHKINFYNFASFFKRHGCKNALYLDGFVSKIYLPKEQIIQYDSHFGVIIAEVSNEKNK